MKKVLSILLTIFCSFGLFAGATGATSSEVALAAAEENAATENEWVDYAGQAVLDFDAETQTKELTVKMFIDGDTTHFNWDGWKSDNTFKARFVAVNTPESTGVIEPWGKKAATYTRSKLETATSIVVESDKADWEPDSTGDRYLSWVWYKAPGSDVYRNLNLELLQEGLAVGSKAGDSRYGALAVEAINQATQAKLHVFNPQAQDPDFFYGSSIELDLKELRLNTAAYELKRVAFEGTIVAYVDHGVYVENFDSETNQYYGIYVFYGYNMASGALKILTVGNRVRITGKVTNFEGSWQVSDLKYNAYKPSAEDIQLISKGHTAANVETTPAQFNSKVPVIYTKTDADGKEITETKEVKYCELALNTTISMKNLYVKSAYTTANGGDNDGAMTLTCQSDGKTIKVRTVVLRHPTTGALVTQDMLVGQMIDVTGIIDYYSGDYQIKALHTGAITVNGEDLLSLFPPVEEPTPEPAPVPSDSEEAGCGSVMAISVALPTLAAAAFVFLRKRED